MCCYADDSTYTVAGKTAEELTEKLSLKYAVLSVRKFAVLVQLNLELQKMDCKST